MGTILAVLSPFVAASSNSILPRMNCVYDGFHVMNAQNDDRLSNTLSRDVCTHMRVKEGETMIGPSAFVGYANLTSVDIPESVRTIHHWAFDQCINLTSIHLPSTLKVIGVGAFHGCSNLTSINLQNVTYIAAHAFADTQIFPPIPMEQSLFKELPIDSLKVIKLSKCHEQIDNVRMEEVEVDETVFAVPAGSVIYCYSIETVRKIMQRNQLHQFEHPTSREKFNHDQMKAFKKKIIKNDELDEEDQDFQFEGVEEIENDKKGKRMTL